MKSKNAGISKNQLFLAAVIIGAGLIYLFSTDIELTSNQSQAQDASLAIDYGDGNQRIFQGEVVDAMTLLDAFRSSAKGGGFEFKYSRDDSGNVRIDSIDGISNSGGKKWYFYINGNLVSAGNIDKVFVKGGDLIEAKFE